MEKFYMLHGFMGTGETHFKHQIDNFNDSYEVEAIDLPGHGASKTAADGDYIEHTIDHVINVINSKGKGYILVYPWGHRLRSTLLSENRTLLKGSF